MMTRRLRQTGLALAFGALALVLLAPLAVAQEPAPEDFPAPTRITVQDDEEDGSGTRLIVQWAVPKDAEAVEGYQLGGYRVHVVEHVTGEMATIRTQQGGENAELSLDMLHPGKKYVIRVGAVYLPEHAMWTP